MTPKEEAAYIRGRQALAREMLSQAGLDPIAENALSELHDAKEALRRLFEDLGLEFIEDLNLGDLIDKHLAPNVERA